MSPTIDASALLVRRIALDGAVVVLTAESAASTARCPACGWETSRCHDRYRRRVQELPWRGHVVRLEVTVRRFVCPDPDCATRTFAEDLGNRIAPRARRSADAQEELLAIARELGGRAGARRATRSGLPVGRDALLRLLRRSTAAAVVAPRVLGVDDLAVRRGRRYATILVDLETHRPIDLLEGREAETLGRWLVEHPGVEVIARDRAEAYAEGAAAGAPDAVQVADRFHLVKNAGEALVDLLRTRKRRLDAAAVEEAAPPSPEEETGGGDPPASVAPDRRLSPSAQRSADRRAARVARWAEVRSRHAAQQPLRRIAREMHLARETVRRLARTPLPPRNQRVAPPRPPPLASPTPAPYVPYLQDQWQAGCTNASQLCREIVARGYTGSYSLLHQATRPWRPPRAPAEDRRTRAPTGRRRRDRRYLVRHLCLTPPARLTSDERDALDGLLAADPGLAAGHDLLRRFRGLVAARDAGALDAWLADARASALAGFVALANSISADRAAVDAALTLRWSTGPVEGLIHKAKLLKRQGYGRATLPVLRARVLAA